MKETFKNGIELQKLKSELIDVCGRLIIIEQQIYDLYEDYYHDMTNESLDTDEVIEYYLQFNETIRVFNNVFRSKVKEKFAEFIDDRERVDFSAPTEYEKKMEKQNDCKRTV